MLKIYDKEVRSVFEILGNHENDITKSIGYCLSECPCFLDAFLKEILKCDIIHLDLNNVNIYCQRTQTEGITDLEIVEEGKLHIIIEAKRWFGLPSKAQLQKYVNDLIGDKSSVKKILTLSDLQAKKAITHLPSSLSNISIEHMTYKDILTFAESSISSSSNHSKRILCDLIRYLKGVTKMKNDFSNIVYVVPINGDSIIEHDGRRQYHCRVGNGFIKEAPNYLGFRFGGKLQYINHVEDVEYYDDNGCIYFRFFLGPDILPIKTIKTGGKYQGTKFYCDIDLLLTCDTIIEASKETKKRHNW